jgi:hypothetical protein
MNPLRKGQLREEDSFFLLAGGFSSALIHKTMDSDK